MAVVKRPLFNLNRRSRKKAKKPKKGKKEYRKYLKSRHWQKTRNLKMGRAAGRCEKCGAKATEVHHKTYKRVGSEKLSDLMAVCRDCHRKLHKIKKSKGKKK